MTFLFEGGIISLALPERAARRQNLDKLRGSSKAERERPDKGAVMRSYRALEREAQEGQGRLNPLEEAGDRESSFMESLILAQDERWRRA